MNQLGGVTQLIQLGGVTQLVRVTQPGGVTQIGKATLTWSRYNKQMYREMQNELFGIQEINTI